MNSKAGRIRDRTWMLMALVVVASALSALSGTPDDNDPGPLLNPRLILSTWTNSPQRMSPYILDVVAGKSGENLLVLKLSREGYRLYQQQSYLAGVNKFKRALDIDPKNCEARLGLATGLIKLDRYTVAIGMLEKMVEDFPRDYRVRNNLSWLYSTVTDESLRDPVKAVARAQEAVIMAPEDAHVWSTLSEAHYVAGNYRRATGASAEALQMVRKDRGSAAQVEEYTRQWNRCRAALLAATEGE